MTSDKEVKKGNNRKRYLDENNRLSALTIRLQKRLKVCFCLIIILVVLASLLTVGLIHIRGSNFETEQDGASLNNSITSDIESEAGANSAISRANLDESSDSAAKALSDDANVRKVYLTFDDGPSTKTDAILDILDKYGVKATFFVCGKPEEKYQAVYKRITDDGHTLGMHSYSHKYSEIYDSLDGFQNDLHKLQNFLYDTTGVWTELYRFPGGSSNTASNVSMSDLTAYLTRSHITYYDWNIYGGDDVDAKTLTGNVINNLGNYSEAVILLHDASDKEETVEALPEIIEYIQGMDNTEILPITDDTVPIQHEK